MKTARLFLLSLTLIGTLSACQKHFRKEGNGQLTTATRAVSTFNSIDVDGKYVINTHYSADPHVEINTDDNIINDVHTFVQDNKLFIEMNDDYYNYDYTSMTIHIYGPDYSDVKLNGDITFNVIDTVHTSYFHLEHNGDGFASVKYEGAQFELKINGSANASAVGECSNETLTVNGNGKITASGMLAQHGNVNVNGNGKIYVNCTSTLSATIDGNGHIYYYGNPAIDTHISGNGSIEHQ